MYELLALYMFTQALEGTYIYLQCVLIQSVHISIFISPTQCQRFLRVSCFSSFLDDIDAVI